MMPPGLEEAIAAAPPGRVAMFRMEYDALYLLRTGRLGLRMMLLAPRGPWVIESAPIRSVAASVHTTNLADGVTLYQFAWGFEMATGEWCRHGAAYTEAHPDAIPRTPLLCWSLPSSSWITRKGKTVQGSGTLVMDLLRVRPT